MRVLVAALLGLTLAAPAAADLTLKCDFPRQGQGSWVNGPVVLHYVTGEKSAVVGSDFITAFVGKPIEARVLKDNPGQVVLTWEVKASDRNKKVARMKYTLNILKDGAKVTYHGQPLGFDNPQRNEGKCMRVKK